MQDNIPGALIAAFERHYDCSWEAPALRNERLAWRAAWSAAMESKQCLHQIQEPAPVQTAPAVVAVPDEVAGLLEALESMVDVCESSDFDGAPSDAHMDKSRAAISAYRAALAATPADHIADAGKMVAAPAGWKLVPVQVPDSAFPWVSGGYSTDYRAHDPRDQKIIEDRAQRTWEAILDGIAAAPAADAAAVPKWIDDPHDIEQGQMLNPEWVKAQEAAAAPAAVAGSAPCTFMTADQARDWAWNKVREDVGTEGWTVMDSVNYYGFYMWGWNYRAQYELQRTATRSAVIQEILSAAPAAAAPVVLPEPAAWINQRCIVRDGECAGHEPQELNFNRHGDWDKSIALFTEQQVRALLAQAATTGVAAPAAPADMAHPDIRAIYFIKGWDARDLAPSGAGDEEMRAAMTAIPDAEPQAQADARDAERYRLLTPADVIEAEDDFLQDDCSWKKDEGRIWVGASWTPLLRPVRRAIAAIAAAKGK